MPRLPDIDSLGARPVPQYRRSIVSNRAAGSVAGAVGDIGAKIASAGQGMIEKEDRLAYSAAKAKILAEDMKAREELRDDPDFGSFEARYTERMQSVRGEASKLIKSNSDRALFESDTNVDLERGLGAVREVARSKRIVQGKAELESSLFSLDDTAANADDDDTRQTALITASELLKGASEKGIIDAIEAGDMGRKFVAGNVLSRIDRAILSDDVKTARKLFESNRKLLDTSQEDVVERQLVGRENNLIAEDDARVATSYSVVDGIPTVATSSAMPKPWKGDNRIYKTPGVSGRVSDVSSAVKSALGDDTHITRSFTAGARTKQGNVSNHSKPGAVDVRPRSDMTFQDAVAKLSAKHTIVEAIDETSPEMMARTGATGKHWHFVLAPKTGGDVDQGPETINLNDGFAAIDIRAEKEGWQVERVERAKVAFQRRVQRNNMIKAQEEDSADEIAAKTMLEAGDGFRVSQIPSSVRAKMSVRALASATDAEKRLTAPKAVASNGIDALRLNVLAAGNPDEFTKADLSQYVGKVTPAELESLAVKQATLRREGMAGPTAKLNDDVTSAINLYGGGKFKYNSRKTDDDDERFMYLHSSIRADLETITGGKRQPTEAESAGAFDRAVVKWSAKQNDGSTVKDVLGERARMPMDVLKRIEGIWMRTKGRKPTPGETQREYLKYKGQEGYW